jgi:DnaJ-class molecular chaperone
MKDYYEILGLERDATEEQMRKAYRRLALKYHPDHNPGDRNAEERFKELSEAYGVLIDPVKRGEYDRWRVSETYGQRTREGFPYSQEEIFQDLFRDPRLNRMFQELFREFERAGVRFDQRFFDKVFFGGRGVLFGGIFIWGSFGSSRLKFGRPHAREKVDGDAGTELLPSGFLKKLGQKIGRFLLGSPRELPQLESDGSIKSRDLSYALTIPSEDAQTGTWVKVTIDRGKGQETVRVKIPPGTRSGTRLRVGGKGRLVGSTSGDLYLTIHCA